MVGTIQGAVPLSQVKNRLIRPDTHAPIGPRTTMVAVPPTRRLTRGTEKNLMALGEIFCMKCST